MRNGEMLCECSVCHDSRTESIPALEHTYVKKYAQRSWLEWLVEHLLNVFFGYDGDLGFYYECEDCHRIMTFEEGTRLNSAGAQSTACVHDHGEWTEEKAPSCTDGVSVRKCTKCGKTLEARTVAAKDPDAHDFGEWTQTKAPTYTEKGEEKRTCKNCEHFEVREIAEKAYIPGDLNGDGVVNMQDVVLLRQYIVGGYEVEINILAADVNEDGKINMQDVVLMRQYIVGGYDVVLK